MGPTPGRNSSYTRRTWRLDIGDGVEGSVWEGVAMDSSIPSEWIEAIKLESRAVCLNPIITVDF
jgi:hypothetical protein